MRNRTLLSVFILMGASLYLLSCKKTNNSPGSSSGPSSTPSGNIVSTVAESANLSPFNNGPHGICADSQGNIYFSTDGATILKINPLGLISTFAGSSNLGCEDGFGSTVTFTKPVDICSDSKDNIYVADMDCSGLRILNGSGMSAHFYTPDGSITPDLASPIAVAVDSKGNVYASGELGTDGITAINSQGIPSHFAGDGVVGNKNGAAASAEFLSISSICVDDNFDIYIADNYSIRKISQGQVTTIAGNGKAGYADGSGSSAQFAGAMGICLDHKGNIYVADPYNYVVRKVTASGLVSTVAGINAQGHKDGDGTVARFNEPVHLCFDLLGNLYVTDLGKTGDEYGDGYIRKIVLKN